MDSNDILQKVIGAISSAKLERISEARQSLADTLNNNGVKDALGNEIYDICMDAYFYLFDEIEKCRISDRTAILDKFIESLMPYLSEESNIAS